MGNWVYVRNKKTKPNEPGWWPEKKRLEAVTTYLATGSMPLTASIINVPQKTIEKWKTMPWWLEKVEQFRDEDTLKLDAKLSKVLAKSLEAVEDRLENGEVHMDKAGRIHRVPAKLRDVHRVAADLIDRRQVIQKTAVPQHERTQSTEGRLLKLAEAFAQFVHNNVKPEKVVGEVYENDPSLPPEYLDAIDRGGEDDALNRPKDMLEVSNEQTSLGVQQEESKG